MLLLFVSFLLAYLVSISRASFLPGIVHASVLLAFTLSLLFLNLLLPLSLSLSLPLAPVPLFAAGLVDWTCSWNSQMIVFISPPFMSRQPGYSMLLSTRPERQD